MSFLSPLDLLQVPDREQDIIRCLIRHPQLTAQEIASRTQIPLKEIKELLLKMVTQAHLSKSTKGNEDVFQVFIGERNKKPTTSSGNSLLDSLFG